MGGERDEGAREEGGGEEDGSGPIKYNYFPIEWKLFGNERRAIDDIHTFIKRARGSDRPSSPPSLTNRPPNLSPSSDTFPFRHLARDAILRRAQKTFEDVSSTFGIPFRSTIIILRLTIVANDYRHSCIGGTLCRDHSYGSSLYLWSATSRV